MFPSLCRSRIYATSFDMIEFYSGFFKGLFFYWLVLFFPHWRQKNLRVENPVHVHQLRLTYGPRWWRTMNDKTTKHNLEKSVLLNINISKIITEKKRDCAYNRRKGICNTIFIRTNSPAPRHFPFRPLGDHYVCPSYARRNLHAAISNNLLLVKTSTDFIIKKWYACELGTRSNIETFSFPLAHIVPNFNSNWIPNGSNKYFWRFFSHYWLNFE